MTAAEIHDIDEPTEHELYSERAEVSLMGGVAFHGSAAVHVLDQLDPAAFYRPARETVWRALRALAAEKLPMGPADVARWLSSRDEYHPGVQQVIQREMSQAAPLDLLPTYAGSVADLYQRRRLVQVVNRMRGDLFLRGASASQALALVRERLDELDSGEDDPGGPMSWAQLGEEFDALTDPDAPTDPSTPSPWPTLDEVTGGLVAGRMYVFGGRPGHGKSVAALNVAASAAAGKRHVLVFSQEMSSFEVTGRIYAAGARVSLSAINRRRLSFDDQERIRYYRKRLGNISLRVHATPCSWGYVKAAARAQKHHRGLDVLVVDYLQLIRVDEPGRSREQEVALVSRELKQLARELECAVVVPAQLNRGPEQRGEKKPAMSDLRDSGQIEQDADAVILLWPKVEERAGGGEARTAVRFIVDKNRHGPTCLLEMDWNGGYGLITDPALDGRNF